MKVSKAEEKGKEEEKREEPVVVIGVCFSLLSFVCSKRNKKLGVSIHVPPRAHNNQSVPFIHACYNCHLIHYDLYSTTSTVYNHQNIMSAEVMEAEVLKNKANGKYKMSINGIVTQQKY